MTIFTLHQSTRAAPQIEDDRLGGDTRLVSVKDGFSWVAFFFTLPWLLVNRLWLWSAAYVALMIALSLLVNALDLNEAALSAAMTVASLFIAFEAGALRAEGLGKRGYRQVASVLAHKRDEAELKYLSTTHRVVAAV